MFFLVCVLLDRQIRAVHFRRMRNSDIRMAQAQLVLCTEFHSELQTFNLVCCEFPVFPRRRVADAHSISRQNSTPCVDVLTFIHQGRLVADGLGRPMADMHFCNQHDVLSSHNRNAFLCIFYLTLWTMAQAKTNIVHLHPNIFIISLDVFRLVLGPVVPSFFGGQS